MSFISDCNDIAKDLRTKKPNRLLSSFSPPFTLISRDQVESSTGLSRSKIYAMMDSDGPYYDKTFPLPLKVGMRAVAWRADEIEAWMKALPRASYTDSVGDDE